MFGGLIYHAQGMVTERSMNATAYKSGARTCLNVGEAMAQNNYTMSCEIIVAYYWEYDLANGTTIDTLSYTKTTDAEDILLCWESNLLLQDLQAWLIYSNSSQCVDSFTVAINTEMAPPWPPPPAGHSPPWPPVCPRPSP
ncbi:hypothetical protein CYMTET_32762 [Cymbomonas tetramitiformis]|uniref:Uncharacterized protein n=1 Tax=Cymbomonas tetramitiformis TaxID=36881 RepID=A0AAE0KRL8_9CHLO|nr:hypothetical protein CYMTET_32762 [Cymbomonas tetramitiformis]